MRATVRHVVLGRGVQPGAPFGLFAAGEQGFWFDPSDLSTMFQDSTGSTPAVVDSPVGLIRDKSGRGNHASQATSDSRPILRADGGLRYLEFDGTDDYLATPTIDLGGDVVSIFAGVRKASDASQRVVLAGAGTEQLALWAPISAAATFTFRTVGSGTQAAATSAASFPAPITAVLTGIGDISTDTSILRINGTQAASVATDQGAGNYAAAAFHIGRRATGVLYHSGRIYQLAMVGRVATASEISAVESYVAVKSGVTF